LALFRSRALLRAFSVLSAGLAMGSATDEQIALPLGLAGLAALLGLLSGSLALVNERHVAVEIAAAVGVTTSAVLGVVALVFALSFHW
jgi:hypothetical protein